MSSRLAQRALRGRDDDAGFTVVEVVVAIAIVTIVMTSLAAFFVNSAKITDYQSQKQTASQVAETAVDKARSLTGVGAVRNRDKTSSDALWAAAQITTSAAKFPGVKDYLTNLGEAWDPTSGLAANAGYTAPLTTRLSGNSVTLGGTVYSQNWFLGYCLRQSTGTCSAGSDPDANSTYLQVIVDVTWTAKSCANSLCSYITAGTISQAPDPVFDQSQGAPKPRIVNPGNQTNEVGQSVSLPITVTGGTAPLTWTAPLLPAGLVWDATTSPVSIHGKPTTVTSTPFKVMLQVTDTFGYVSTAAFTWTVTAPPLSLASIPARRGLVNFPVSFTATATGGIGPYTWTMSGQPPGTSISGTTTTGTISGTPTTLGTYTTTVKVADSIGQVASQTFTWIVGFPVNNTSATTVSNGNGTFRYNITATASGGGGRYTWTYSMSPSVVMTTSRSTNTTQFTAQNTSIPNGTYTLTITATDQNGKSGQLVQSVQAH